MKGFIFDMDGVIVDSEPIHFRLIREVYLKFGKTFTHEDHKKITGMCYLEIWDNFIKKFNLPVTKEELNKSHSLNLIKEIKMSNEVLPSESIIEFINDLHSNGVKLAVASSSGRPLINAILEKFNIEDKFNAIISGEELPKSKPHPEIFLKALSELGVEAHEALVVEDSRNGIKAAKAAGIKCLAFLNNGKNEQNTEEANFQFNSFSELTYTSVKKLL